MEQAQVGEDGDVLIVFFSTLPGGVALPSPRNSTLSDHSELLSGVARAPLRHRLLPFR